MVSNQTEFIMRPIVSKIIAIALLIGIAQTLSACVVYERPAYYHGYYRHW